MEKDHIILTDFDGTIVLSDIAEEILKKFADKKWLEYEDLFLAGQLSLGDTLEAEYSLINASKETILEEIDRITKVRQNFEHFVRFILEKKIDIIVVSAGIDFTIHHILTKLNLPRNLKLVSVKTQYNPDGLTLKVTKPNNYNNEITDYKLDLVEHYKSLGYIVHYIGDSNSDFQAVKLADFVYSVKYSKLSSHMNNLNKDYIEFEDFNEIINYFDNSIKNR